MSIHDETKTMIEEILQQEFSPSFLEVIDDSQAHQGHAEAMLHKSAGHFKVRMKSNKFDGIDKIKRHRMVYEKLSHLMEKRIHAISLYLLASHENFLSSEV